MKKGRRQPNKHHRRRAYMVEIYTQYIYSTVQRVSEKGDNTQHNTIGKKVRSQIYNESIR